MNENDDVVYFKLLTLKNFKIDNVKILFNLNHDDNSKSNIDYFLLFK